MPLSLSDLYAIATKAENIPEYLPNHTFPDVTQMTNEEVSARLSVWCQLSAGSDWQLFQERLAWDGLNLAEARRLLTPVTWRAEVPLPAWTTILQEALSLLETMPDNGKITEKSQWPFLDASKPVPFEDLLSPFVRIAWLRFTEQAEVASGLLAEAVHLTLQRHLLQVLASLALDTFYTEFKRVRAEIAASKNNEILDEPSLYLEFLLRMRQGGLGALLCEYSVLARLLATTCNLWVEANIEFAQRLAADWPALEQMFGGGDNPGGVIEIQPALSDAHAGRRCVMELTFGSGVKVIYKPRSVGMEKAFYALLNWCNEQGTTPAFKIPALLDCSTYGWMESVACEPCQDSQALLRYYQRAGMLLCLVYTLGGRDCFFDHLIAHGEQPVLVDASTLLQSYLRPDPQKQQNEDWEPEPYSVLHTGLLATWLDYSASFKKMAGLDIGGLGLEQISGGPSRDMGRVQSLQPPLLLKHGTLKSHRALHLAHVADSAEQSQEEDLRDALCTGFQHMYQILLRRRAALQTADSPLWALNTQLSRIAYRSRQIYEHILPKLLEPQALRDAVTRSMLLEPLGRECVPLEPPGSDKGNPSYWWIIFTAERQALLQGDIPVFYARTDSSALQIAPGREVASCLSLPGFELLLRRLEHLSEEDMHCQLALVRQALHREITLVAVASAEKMQSGAVGKQPEWEVLETQTLAIADDIARHAIETGRESVTWAYPAYSLRFQRFQFQPMRYGLSDGLSGIAFFLAALAQSSGISRYRRLASAAIQPLHCLLRTKGEQLVREAGLGAGPGLGSIIYALTRISQFLTEPELLADARAAARLITPERIASDERLDVFLGTAGALLGLLALHETSPDQEILELAICCGQHLLHSRTPSQAGYRVWPTLGRQHITGFSHGAAGIIYALLRLYALTGDADLLEAAQEGLCYEDRALMPEVGNWGEVVGANEIEPGISWCHGAPGIGLARLGGLFVLDTPSIRQDIEVALQTTQQISVQAPDHLCCGACGRIELLLTASRYLGRPDLADVAIRWIGQILTRAERRGEFALSLLHPRGTLFPQLFQGSAGLGYTLLRLMQPEVFPSILLWK